MSEEQVKNSDKGAIPEPIAGEKRERSTIQFPYNDLEDATELAQAINDNAGLSCSLDQLAAFVKQSMTSGAFRLRLSTASTFGITQNERGEVTLTELGRKIVDPSRAAEGRVEAFLNVPLYKAIYEKYRGYQLPPVAALEREIGNLGVSSKQTDKARWAFMRSAKFAGFFAHGEDRLVRPAGGIKPETKPIDPLPPKDTGEQGGGNGGGGNGTGNGGGFPPGIDPLIMGLLIRLPKAGANWSLDDRKLWLDLMEGSFKLIYKEGGKSE